MMKSSTRGHTPHKSPPKVYAPSQSILDSETGEKYRLCASAAVLNSKNQLLVGERLQTSNAWQAPQGGVDDAWSENKFQAETIVQAAARELYEEMGLRLGTDVVLCQPPATTPNDDDSSSSSSRGIRYKTNGTDNWMTRAGYTGQELHWVLFRCVNGRGDQDPSVMCDLQGQNAEAPEFRRVAWKEVGQVVQEMWPGKVRPYEHLLQGPWKQECASWREQCEQSIKDFSGDWSRDAGQSENLAEALMARGLESAQAQEEAAAPYQQRWSPTLEQGKLVAWNVITFARDGVTPRRTLEYPFQEWQEEYQGKATLFGTSESLAVLKRRTFYAPHPIQGSSEQYTVAHVTVTVTPNGDTEESRRYIQNDKMILKRTYWSKTQSEEKDGVVSFETFVRGASITPE